MGATSLSDPMANPGGAPDVLAKFPPTLFVTGTRASDLSSAAYSHAQLLKAGIDSQLYVMEGGWHGAFNAEPDTPEARDTFAYIVKWFDRHLGQKTDRKGSAS
jgi:monoterpene epsilon-lactone hydrolase